MRLALSVKLLLGFLAISLSSLAAFGYVALSGIRQLGTDAFQTSNYVGWSAVSDAAVAFESLNRRMVQLKTEDVAREIAVYLDNNPGRRASDLQSDRRLREIAIQSVSTTGFTSLLEAGSGEDAREAADYLTANHVDRVMVVGLGSNLLFQDGLFDGAVLRLVPGSRPQIRDLGEGLLEAFAGETLDSVITFGFERGYTGLEWAGGLPGTVGAGVRGNVGAFGGELEDVVVSAELLARLDSGCEVRRLTNAELRFGYRDSAVKRDRRLVVTSAVFRLHPASEEDLQAARRRYQANIDYRNQNHPMEYPTCGSVFKNIARPEEVERMIAVWPDIRENVQGRWHGKVSMGYAIKRLGLSGYQIGGAQISTKHNNFIVNLGTARFTDVYGLIEKVRAEFNSTFGFVPEPEVEIVGITE